MRFVVVHERFPVARSLAQGFLQRSREANIPVIMHGDAGFQIADDDLYVLIDRAKKPADLSGPYVVLQCEQPAKLSCDGRYKEERLQIADFVWEFSPKTAKCNGEKARFLPFPLLTMAESVPNVVLTPFENRFIDVLLLGAKSERRRFVMHKLLDAGYTVLYSQSHYGIEKQKVLLQAKIVVNIHYYNPSHQEIPRIHEALDHGASVVSELSDDAENDANFSDCDAVVFVEAHLNNEELARCMVDTVSSMLATQKTNAVALQAHAKTFAEKWTKKSVSTLRSEYERLCSTTKNN